jgi:predicted nucleotidyltransferase
MRTGKGLLRAARMAVPSLHFFLPPRQSATITPHYFSTVINPMASLTEQLTDELSRHPQIQLALLFGSMASGLATDDSDIDLAILADTELGCDFKMELIACLASIFGRPVDVVDLRMCGADVVGQALKGKRLIGSDVTQAQLLTRQLIDHADYYPLQQRTLKERRDLWTQS